IEYRFRPQQSKRRRGGHVRFHHSAVLPHEKDSVVSPPGSPPTISGNRPLPLPLTVQRPLERAHIDLVLSRFVGLVDDEPMIRRKVTVAVADRPMIRQRATVAFAGRERQETNRARIAVEREDPEISSVGWSGLKN